MALTEKDIVRFWSKVDKNGPLPDQSNPHYAGLDRCWVWTGAKFRTGYGEFRLKNRMRSAHRVAWIIKHGSIPTGEGHHGSCIIHKCDRRDCCNTAHLQVGSNADNAQDRENKKRNRPPCGEAQGASKLTDDKVIKIRLRYKAGGIYQRELAKEFGVSQRLISLVTRCEAWKHITAPTVL